MRELEEKINLVFDKEKKEITIDELIDKLNNEYSLGVVKSILDKKLNNYEIIENNKGFIKIEKTNYRKGRLLGNNKSGNVYVDNFYTNKHGEEVVYTDSYLVKKEDFNGAIDGDVVIINITDKEKKIATVDEIIDRNINTVMGVVYKEGNTYYLDPVDPHKKNLTISFDDYDDLVEGENVIVKLDELRGNDFYIANLYKRLGHKDDPDFDIINEAYRNGFEVDFSEEAIKQSEEIPNAVRDIDKIGRVDLTDKEIFTIDGDDTKDIDDAISLEMLENGNYLLGVHIADPAYYIEEDSPLDKDAFSRGTSLYLADRVIPMLPHRLSNGICSLNPNVERLTQSCMMEIDKNGNIVNYNIFRSVIKSNIQMTYKKVNKILKEDKVDPMYISHVETLKNMKKLADVLNRKRKENCSINIERSELKVELNSEGKPVKLIERSQDVGENLIEEFMLVANETICKHLVSNFLPSVNRIHEQPDQEKIIEFLKLLRLTGTPYNKNNLNVTDPSVLQGISDFIGTIEDNAMLKLHFLKSLKRARYSASELGHSGLAKEYYCHFTSPMRRYPDLIQNRILSDFVYDKPSEDERKELLRKWKHKLPEIALHSSRKEKYSDFCEGDVLLMKCAEYMRKFKGKEFEGTVVDIDANGLVVELDNMIEGKVRPRNFVGSYYYNDKAKSFISRENKDNYSLGDRLKLQLVETDKEKKLIDFKIIEKLKSNVNLERECQKIKSKSRKMYYNSNKGVRR